MNRRILPAAALVAAALAGCTGGGADPDRPPGDGGDRTSAPTPRAPTAAERLGDVSGEVDLSTPESCDRVARDAVATALGVTEGGVPAVRRTDPGDVLAVQVDGRTTAVPVQEHGCSWRLSTGPRRSRAPGAREAALRVFVPPVDSGRAAALVEAAGRTPGCADAGVDVRLGDPGVALACRPGELRLEGVVGQRWVVCSLTRQDLRGELGEAGLAPRLATWCATALEQVTGEA